MSGSRLDISTPLSLDLSFMSFMIKLYKHIYAIYLKNVIATAYP